MQKGAERNSLVQSGVDLARIQAAVREMLLAIGEDPDREGLRETPRRIAEMYQELFAGLWQDPARHLQVTFEEGHDELVIVKAIPFHSMCEHHFMPFFGVAHVGYLPRGRVVGISKIARVVEELARRPQLQERLAAQVADTLMTGLEPQGVGGHRGGAHLHDRPGGAQAREPDRHLGHPGPLPGGSGHPGGVLRPHWPRARTVEAGPER